MSEAISEGSGNTGSNGLPTRHSVEATPLGRVSISITSGCRDWLDTNIQARLGEKIVSAFRSDVLFTPLRLVQIAGRFDDEVRRWQSELGLPVFGTTARSETVAVGKTLTWGDGQPKSTFSVIVLHEPMALGLVEGDPRCEGLLRHELGHVKHDLLALHLWGHRSWPANNDWPAIREFFARNVLSEFQAEHDAVQAVGVAPHDGGSEFTLCLIATSIRLIAAAIERYHVERDIGAVWGIATSEMDASLPQLGRQLGVFAARMDGDSSLNTFIRKLVALAPAWREGALRLNESLNDFSWSDGIETIEDAIEELFMATGLRPIQDAAGLRLFLD